MAFWCVFFMRVIMFFLGILRLAYFSLNCSCMAPRTLAVIVIRGFVFQPLFHILLISESYFACFWAMACSGNLSWQYVNSMNCMVCVHEGSKGVVVWFKAPSIQRMYGLNLARHWQLVGGQLHCMSLSGTVCS